jgi:hypothetical protein
MTIMTIALNRRYARAQYMQALDAARAEAERRRKV